MNAYRLSRNLNKLPRQCRDDRKGVNHYMLNKSKLTVSMLELIKKTQPLPSQTGISTEYYWVTCLCDDREATSTKPNQKLIITKIFTDSQQTNSKRQFNNSQHR